MPNRAAEFVGLLALVLHQRALTLAQVSLVRKEGELTASAPLLQELILTGLVVPADAQFTQPGSRRHSGHPVAGIT